MNLETIQKQLYEAIVTANPLALRDVGVVPAKNLSLERAISVYAEGYVARLTESLGESFESVWWVLGDEDFFQVCRDYISAHRSHSHDLADYGRKFPIYLAQRKDLLTEIPFLSSLARLEWAFQEVFHAAHMPADSPESLQRVLSEFGDVCLEFSPSLRILKLQYSVYEIWKWRASPQEDAPDFQWDCPEAIIFYKGPENVVAQSLKPWMFDLLGSLSDGQALSKAIADNEEVLSCVAPDSLQGFFQDLAGWGLITKVSPPNTDKTGPQTWT